MARRRTVKPEFFKDRVMARLGSRVAILYEALWCLADDGQPAVARCDPDLVKGEMLMRWEEYTTTATVSCLQALADAGRVRFYAIGGDLYGEIPTLHAHSRPNNPSTFRHPRGGQEVTNVAAFVAGQHGLQLEPDSRGSHGGLTGASRGPTSPEPMPLPLPVPLPVPEAVAAVGPSDVPSSANGVPTLSYTQRCVVALNEAIQTLPGRSSAVPIPASSQEGVVSWEADGIPVALATRVIAERVRAYRPRERSPYPKSLKYFDAAVRDTWEREAAGAVSAAPMIPRMVS